MLSKLFDKSVMTLSYSASSIWSGRLGPIALARLAIILLPLLSDGRIQGVRVHAEQIVR